jgi:hypothetical protein
MTLLGETPPDERSEIRLTEDGSAIPVLEPIAFSAAWIVRFVPIAEVLE